jgi:tetratricopeptide (TPR) repeat protein
MGNTSSSEKPSNFSHEIPVYALVWLVALVARLLYLWQIRQAPVFTLLMGDGASYDAWARQIANGDWLGQGVFYQAPLYPYFLGIVYALFGTNLVVVRGIQIVIGATSCVLLACAGRGFFSRSTGLLAAFILAVYPTAIFFDCSIQKSVLDLFFICGLLAIMGARLSRQPTSGWWMAAGIVLGLLVLTRENALVFLPILLVWLFVGWWREAWKTRLCWAGLFATGLGIVLLPVAFRNLVVGGEFHLTTAQFGPNFYMGNGKDATGLYRALRWGRGSAKTERDDATTLAERATGKKLSPAGVSHYWTEKALDEIREDPGVWLRLMVRKWLLVWNVSEVGDSEDQYTYSDWSWLLRVLNRFLHFGILCPLAVLGICLTWGQRERLWVLYTMLLGYATSVTSFYVFSRYRFPLAPMLILFAAAGLVGLRDAIREARWRGLITGIATAVVAATVCNSAMVTETFIRASTHYNIADGLLTQQSNPQQAIQHYREAVRLLPEFALARVELGLVLMQEGQVKQAIDEYEQALQFRPDYPEAHNNLGVAFASTGNADEAMRHFRTALQLNPDYTEAHQNLAILLAKQGRIDEAISEVRSALKLDPNSQKLQQALDELKRVKS